MTSKENTITCENIVRAITMLPKNQSYNYINESTHTKISIEEVKLPSGPIFIRRWNPIKGESASDAKVESISMQMITRVANAIELKVPLNIDRLLGASYNTRSALEALLCHTPEFFYCYPGRIDMSSGKPKIKDGHKHIYWDPSTPHQPGKVEEKFLHNLEINEIPAKSVIYNALELPSIDSSKPTIDSTEKRLHLHMQMALYEIGCALCLNTYIAKNDQGAKYKGDLLVNHPRIISDLRNIPMVSSFPGAVEAGKLIDAIWFESLNIPAVFEVENTTGVTSGLTRMLNFKLTLPQYSNMRYIIVAPDELKEKVYNEINKPEFISLHASYLSYSSVSELLALCQSRHLKGVTSSFIETYLEDM